MNPTSTSNHALGPAATTTVRLHDFTATVLLPFQVDMVVHTVVRRYALVAIAVLLGFPTGAGAAPAQEEAGSDDSSRSDLALVDVSNLTSSNVAGTLTDLQAEIDNQLSLLGTAQSNVSAANQALADADNALTNLQFQIEDQTAVSDAIVIDAFINPPSSTALDVLSSDTTLDATIKQAILDFEANESAAALEAPQETLRQLREAKAAQQVARDQAEAAKEEADAALEDLNAAVGRQAQFVNSVRAALAADAAAPQPTDPAEAAARQARRDEIAGELQAAADARALIEAQRAAAEAAARRAQAGRLVTCPVDGPNTFTNSWGAARSGGRRHVGVDMLAARGTPTVAPVAGDVQHRGSSLGGLSWYVYGDNGDMYYGTHLSGYANVGVGHVDAGTVIGYVGDTGNARGTPHLHFEVHPGGGAPVNPYPYVAEVC
jgi:murein DD-endopeptidase MepM/ murein hydrolase activator NlpD